MAAEVGTTTVRPARALRAGPWVALVHLAVAGCSVPHFHQHVAAAAALCARLRSDRVRVALGLATPDGTPQ